MIYANNKKQKTVYHYRNQRRRLIEEYSLQGGEQTQTGRQTDGQTMLHGGHATVRSARLCHQRIPCSFRACQADVAGSINLHSVRLLPVDQT